MLTLLAVLALGTLALNANLVDEDVDTAVDCVSLHWNNDAFTRCRGMEIIDNYSVDYLNQVANQICRNRNNIATCTKKALKPCKNMPGFEDFTERSFGYCDGDSVAPAMADFFKNNAGVSLTRECFMTVLMEIRETAGGPPRSHSYTNSLAVKIARKKSYFKWYVNQYSGMTQTETVAACNGMTRQTIYSLMVATASMVIGWGVDLYPEFVSIAQPATDQLNV